MSPLALDPFYYEFWVINLVNKDPTFINFVGCCKFIVGFKSPIVTSTYNKDQKIKHKRLVQKFNDELLL